MSNFFTVDEIAEVCHEANRVLQRLTLDPAPSPSWEDAERWQTDAAADSVDSVMGGATPEQLHEDWCDAKYAEGWVYGPVRDAEAKTHPCLVPYDQLPLTQQVKDAVFHAIVNAMRGDRG